MQLQGHSFTAATRNGKGIILNSGFHMLYGNLSEKKKVFHELQRKWSGIPCDYSQHDMLRRMRKSPGLNNTHVHPEEERPNRKLQSCASSETQEGKGMIFLSFLTPD